MKNKFLRIISSLLILSFLMAAFSVFSFAEDTEGGAEGEEDSVDNLSIFYNRTFEDGWDYDNGFHYKSISTNSVTVDYEEDALGKYNYFLRYEAGGSNALQTRINFGTESVTHALKASTPGTVVEFSIKADDLAKLGTVVYMITTVSGKTVKMLDINAGGELVLFNGVSGGSLNIGELKNEWINIAYIFDWLQTDLSCKVKIGYGLGNGYSDEYQLTMPYEVEEDVGIKQLYFGFPALASRSESVAAESLGMNFCLDNLKVYQGVRSILELDPEEYGSGVNTHAEKVIDIKEGANVKSKGQILEEALAMKVGVNYALARNERYALVGNSENEKYNGIYGAPVKQGDDVLVPLQLILDYIGFPSYIHPDNMSFDITTGQSTTYITIGRDSATVDGERVALSVAPGYIQNANGESYLVISLEDVSVLFPGWLTIYDNMGLVILYEDTTPDNLNDNAPLVNRSEDLVTMVDIMKRFVFDTVTAEELADGYVANGKLVYNDVKANSNDFTHPYLIADAEDFKALADKYALAENAEGYDATFKFYVQGIIASADEIYTNYANVSGSAYAGIKEGLEPVNKNAGDGYDSKGEMKDLIEYVNILPTLAFAYQITGNDNYAKLAYDWSVALAKWTHWGPGYFEYCAETTSAFAISYDWLYNAYKALELDTEVLAQAIYELGVHDGYVSSSGKICEHARGLGDLSGYSKSKDSNNAIGASGMIIGSLAILDYITGENAPENAYDETMYLIGNNIQMLIANGLDIYAPDGSYIESPKYWEDATSAFFRMVMALETSAGKNYGFMDTWGIEKTCYYAVHIESSDGFIWNYHDSTEYTSLDTDMFNFVGSYFGDENLIAARQKQINDGKTVSIYDVIFYPMNGVNKAPEFALDYHLEAIEGYVARSDWNKGAIYTGLMGGMNNVTHGQIDSGNFIYHNKGITWVMDLGTDNPYIAGFNDAGTRYKLYRNSGEGQNVIIATGNSSISYGQYSAAGGVITSTFSNEHGSYVTLDNKSVYLGTVSNADRGVLLTNDRSTVVLQDELSFVMVKTLAWVLHTGADGVSVDDDGRTAYFAQEDDNGNAYLLRVSIVSRRPDFTFRLESAEKPLLSSVMTNLTSGEREYDRSDISRLVIEAETISFDVAVVFEIVEDYDDPTPVGYEWVSMSEWEPSAPKTGESTTETVAKRGTPIETDIIDNTEDAYNYIKRNTAFNEKLADFYKALANVEYTLSVFPFDQISDSEVLTACADYFDYKEDYEEYMDYINGKAETTNSFALALAGIKTAEAETEEE